MTNMKSHKVPRKTAVKSATGKSGSQQPRSTGPTEDEIRLRAYEIYLEHGCPDGEDLGDWFQAEKELTENIRKRHSD
jgi:hypothetical protein